MIELLEKGYKSYKWFMKKRINKLWKWLNIRFRVIYKRTIVRYRVVGINNIISI